MKKVNLYIHIGESKTGTTALQRFLFNNKHLLTQKGYLYPATGLSGNFEAHHRLAWPLTRKHNTKISPEEIWGQLEREIKSTGLKNVILSSEFFPDVVNMEKLHRLLTERYNTRIIVYLRRQDEKIQSAYNQKIKFARMNKSIHEFVIHGTPSFNMSPYLHFENRLKKWKNTFGKEAIIVRVYEKVQLPRGIFFDFLQAIGLDLTDEYVMPARGINPSLNWDILEFLRLCNFIPMERREHNQLVKPLGKISEKMGGKNHLEQHTLLSPQERIEILKKYEASNQQVARKYLGREDGQLFYDPWPDPNEPWEPYPGLTIEKVVQIVGGLWVEQQKDINTLRQQIQKLKSER